VIQTARQARTYESGGKPPHSKWALQRAELSGIRSWATPTRCCYRERIRGSIHRDRYACSSRRRSGVHRHDFEEILFSLHCPLRNTQPFRLPRQAFRKNVVEFLRPDRFGQITVHPSSNALFMIPFHGMSG
jgi:hypothetical protein